MTEKESKKLELFVPSFEDLWYTKKLLEDPKTMDYNKGYELNYPGYDNDTGCIHHPDEYWRSWFELFVNNEPSYFYAYLMLLESGDFVGEVNLHPSRYNPKWHDMGIVIEGQYRGKGYSKEGLSLLLDVGFKKCSSIAIYNEFEKNRDKALKIHKSVGFREIESKGEYTGLAITSEEYFKFK